MRELRAIIVVCILLGIISLTIPLRFYGTMSSIFGSLTPEPFNFSVVRTLTFVFALPSITLILMGVALYYVVEKLKRVAELEVIRETGEVLGHVKKIKVEDEAVSSFVLESGREIERKDVLAVNNKVIVKMPENEFVDKEVYNESGDFLGYVKNAQSDESGEVAFIEVQRKDKKTEIPVEDVLSVGTVIIVRA